MTHMLAGYIFVGVCYATAAWEVFRSDIKNKGLLADIKAEKALARVVFAFLMIMMLAAVAIAWPFLLLTNLFILLSRHLSATNAK